MLFDQFIARIDHLRRAELPGDAAHEAILPGFAKGRLDALHKDPSPRLSSVAATIFPENGEGMILLIERQAYDGIHSGQISFPGGKVEENDPDLLATALREMEEEVGVPRSAPSLITSLSKVYIPPSRFLVQPYLFYIDQLPPLVANEREVRSIIKMPISHLMDERSIEVGKVAAGNGLFLQTPYFAFQGKVIWGATAMMLNELRTIMIQTQ